MKTLREELTRGGATGRDGNSQYSSTVFGLEEQVKKLKEELVEKDLEMEVCSMFIKTMN